MAAQTTTPRFLRKRLIVNKGEPKLCISTDQFGMIVDHQLMDHDQDNDIVIEVADRLFSKYNLVSWSFEKGFGEMGTNTAQSDQTLANWKTVGPTVAQTGACHTLQGTLALQFAPITSKNRQLNPEAGT